MSNDISVYTEGINDLPHLNTRVNTDNYFENLLEDEDFLSWEPNREYQDMNYDNNRKNKFIEKLPDTDKYYYLDDDYNKTINDKNDFLNQFSNDLNDLRKKDNSYETDSLSDLFNNVKQSIVSGKADYLDVLKDIFSNYMNFVNELRQTISNLNKYQKAGSKEGTVNFDFKSFLMTYLTLEINIKIQQVLSTILLFLNLVCFFNIKRMGHIYAPLMAKKFIIAIYNR